jgi:acetyl-CoA carboxylase carboxyltransferase component
MGVATAMRPATEALAPRELLETLYDRGSLELIRTGVVSAALGPRGRAGDGVVAGAGNVAGRPVYCYAQDASLAGGSLGAAHAETIVRLLGAAGRAGAPVVAFGNSAGARLQEGLAALGGYGRIFRASVELGGWVPQITVVRGTSAGGGAYSPALTDFLLMTARAVMFLTGPGVVHDALGEAVTPEELGGPRLHSRNGVCHAVAADDRHAIELVRALLSHLPSNAAAEPPAVPPEPPAPGDPGDAVPLEPRRAYDVRRVTERLLDGGALLELWPRWARNMVTGLARIEGRPVGVLANQPRHLGGVIDAAAAEKAARFVSICDRFALPLVVLVDTPGFMPGIAQEKAGVIGHGASLLRAFAGAHVPRITVVLRKAYGGACITMNSKDLGADVVFAWPAAELGVMGGAQAVGVLNRRDLEVAADPAAARAGLATAYAEEQLRAEVATRAGFVDELIEPSQTRRRLAWALAVSARP